MTAKELAMKIEVQLHEAAALCDMVQAAALGSDELRNESVACSMVLAFKDLKDAIRICSEVDRE